MPNKLILSSDGLVLDLKPNYLDWEALKFSATINSKKGGWNYKRYFLIALESMLDWEKGVFKSITTNTTVPQREYEFFADRSNSEETKINDPDEEGENAFERAIYNTYGLKKTTKPLNVGGSDYKVLTYQLPLVPKDGAAFKNIDLLAYDSKKYLAIMELKKGGNHGDSPLFAIFESMVYYKVLHGNWARFKEPLAVRLKDYGFDAPQNEPKYKIMIMAPKSYWEYWGILSDDVVSNTGRKLKTLAQKIATDNELLIEFVCTKNKPVFCESSADEKVYRLRDDVVFLQF